MGGRAVRITAVVVVLVLVLLFVLDRLAARLVAQEVATQTQTSQHLATKPSVSIGGGLFLPQVASGDYRDIDIDVRGANANGLRVDDMHAHLDGMHLPLSEILNRDVRTIPVDNLTADVTLTFTDLNAYLAAQSAATAAQQGVQAGAPPRVSADNGGIRVDSTVVIVGASYPVEVVADMGVEPNAVTFTPRGFAQGVAALLPPQWRDAVMKLLTLTVPVQGLPFNLKLTAATVQPTGLRFTAAGQHVILDTTQLQQPGGLVTPSPTAGG
jgi:hypothetical protein